MIKIALSDDFLRSLPQLPQRVQKRAREMVDKFRSNPKAPVLNFERLAGVRDSKLRGLHVDQAYRAICVHPPKGDLYLLAWIDHHDDAYAWARNRVFEVNPASGALQVYGVEAGAAGGVGFGIFCV